MHDDDRDDHDRRDDDDRTATDRAFPITIRELVWLLGFVVTGVSGFVTLAYRIDSRTQDIVARLEQQKLAQGFLEGRLVELRAQVADQERQLQAHVTIAGHPVGLDRLQRLTERVEAVERELRDLRAPARRNTSVRAADDEFARGVALLPSGRAIHYGLDVPPPADDAAPGFGEKVARWWSSTWRSVWPGRTAGGGDGR